MYLKSLEIHGFKSFAEKVGLTFLPPTAGRHSLTAIVGPNGSGKSNVADAIRWVMGEQSMKTLRGKKGEDIIFAGGEGRGKMGEARVTMTLDNSDQRMPIPYDEVVITRSIDRLGSSEYLICGNPTRLFDLQVLLAQAQFGHGSYSVIGQGMIDRLLLQTPSERKDFFDEACGIKEFQIKRHQASLKLERTRGHMDEAELLLNEIRPRLKTLSRQVKKLEERQGIELQLREKQEQYYVTMWQSQEEALNRLRSDAAKRQVVLTQKEQQLQSLQAALATHFTEGSRTAAFQELQREYERSLAKKIDREREAAQLAVKLQSEYSSAGQEDVGWLLEKREGAKAAQDRLVDSLAEVETALREAQAGLTKSERAYETTLSERARLREELRQVEEDIARLKNESLSISTVEVRAIDYILRQPTKYGTVFGTIADLAEVSPEYALALDIAAGAHGSSIVVESDTVAERWINHLREERLGIATFLPINTVKPRVLPADSAILLSRPGVKGLAKDLLRYDKKFEVVFSFLFGATFIIDTIATARAVGIGRIRMVTMGGDVIETSGAMKGGYREKKKFASGFSGSQRNARVWEEKETALLRYRAALEGVEKTLGQKDQAVRDAARLFETLKAQVDGIAERSTQAKREYQTLHDEYRLRTANPKEHGQLLASMRERQRELIEEARTLEQIVVRAKRELDQFHEAEEQKKQQLMALQTEMQAAQGAVSALLTEKNEKAIEIARLETKQEDVALEAETELRDRIDDVVRRGIAPVPIADLSKLLEEVQKLKYALSLIGGIDEEVMAEYQSTKERHDGLELQLTDLDKAFTDLRTLIAELDEMMAKKRAQTFRDIRKEFTRYFSLLFGGGKADIVEVRGEVSPDDTDDVVEKVGEISPSSQNPKSKIQNPKSDIVGIDIVANPPGKKISNIQALSGGERTMTSLALLCAILHTNPAPFVVLDEVEAALDEANTVRFGTILTELTAQSQFIIITHNRATMHIAGLLYGVTMGTEGVSRLVSVKLGDA